MAHGAGAADPSGQNRQSQRSLGPGFAGLKAALMLLEPRGSVSLQKVSPKNCRPISEIICKQFVHGYMGNLWQAGNTMPTSISQPSVLITKLHFPDTHLLCHFFLYQKHSLCVSIFFPQQLYKAGSLLQMIFLTLGKKKIKK